MLLVEDGDEMLGDERGGASSSSGGGQRRPQFGSN